MPGEAVERYFRLAEVVELSLLTCFCLTQISQPVGIPNKQ